MDSKTIINGIYAIEEKIGKGGMAAVFRASVDLNRFDYTRLYAYTQVQADNHAERAEKAREFAARMEGKALDIATIRSILEAHEIPLPESKVAIKVAKEGTDYDRFEAEWRNLLWLNHANVIRVYDGGVYTGRPFYAMELVDDLVGPDEISREFIFSDRLNVVIDAARGLAYLHAKGIVHRDVKPDNFITSKDSQDSYVTRVTDLGLAKNVNESLGLTSSGATMGTPYFMAPEQIESSKDVDARADIYSLGASLYDLLIGKPPYHNKTSVFEIIAAVTRGEQPIPPNEHISWFPHSLASIIRCAMAWSPEQRYACIDDFREDLETYLKQESSEFLQSTIMPGSEAAGAALGVTESSAYNYSRISVATGATLVGEAEGKIAPLDSSGFPGPDEARLSAGIHPEVQPDLSVTISGMQTNAGWMITVSIPEPAVDIQYRVAEDGDFASLGVTSFIHPQTGRPSPNATFALPLDQVRTTIFIIYTDAQNEAKGPFELLFDPAVEYTRGTKNTLDLIKHEWVAFREWEGELFLYTTALQTCRNAIRKAAWSLDEPTLDKQFEMQPDGYNLDDTDFLMVKLPKTARRVFVQLTYRDGTVSAVQEFKR
ncbi:serine/threonine protein kinase [Planctomycetota bacterium]